MRTVTLQSVYEAIVRRHGMDPRGDVATSDAARSIGERINYRVRKAWRFWEWPELTVTEERAYRTVWNATRQFLRVGENGQPDEVFYLVNTSYYRVKATAGSDPPVGTAPTNTTYWGTLSPLDRFIAYDQSWRLPIGDVIGIYGSNPRLNCNPMPLNYRPSEKGIDVCYSGATVFVKYSYKPEKYTLVPFMPNRQYAKGDLVYYSLTGDAYASLADNNTQLPTNATYWRRVPFPEILAEYVKAGVYADGLRESDPSDRSPDQGAFQGQALLAARSAKVRDADAEAQDALISEIDPLLRQRQWYYYYQPSPKLLGAYCCSPPYTNGGAVTTIPDTDQSGSAPPLPSPTVPGIIWEYHPEITALTGATLSIAALKTTVWLAGSLIELVIAGQRQTWQLATGAKDVNDPGQVAPNDYNATTNNKYWAQVT